MYTKFVTESIGDLDFAQTRVGRPVTLQQVDILLERAAMEEGTLAVIP